MTNEPLSETVYRELYQLAQSRLATEAPGNTLTATALVHEVWIRLKESSIVWQGREHYVRTAASTMRRILVDRARVKLADKRGGGAKREPLSDIAAPEHDPDFLAVDVALQKLALIKPQHAELVELRFFAGLPADEAAQILGISPSTADRMWRYAKAWLQVEIASLE